MAAVVQGPDKVSGFLRHFSGAELTDPMTTSAYAPRAPSAGHSPLAARAMPVCGSGKRIDCVVDGDTVWLDGVKIRIANIDAPEMRGRCALETSRARDATRRLSGLLQGLPIDVSAEGTDRYGRLLARLSTPAGDVGEALVRERLAVRWRGRKKPVETWCGRA